MSAFDRSTPASRRSGGRPLAPRNGVQVGMGGAKALRRVLLLVGPLVAPFLGCSDPTPVAPPPHRPTAPLGSGVVARVGPSLVRAEAVGAVAAAQGLDRAAALEALVADSLLALGAEEAALHDGPVVRIAGRGVLARSVLRELSAAASKTPPTDEELEHMTAVRWIDVDRPESFRTVHALAHVEEGADGATRARARRLAEKWLESLGALSSRVAATPPPSATLPADSRFRAAEIRDEAVADFAKSVRAVDPGPVRVTVEPLPAVACDGRVVDRDIPDGQRFDPAFARAACTLARRGDLSPVTASAFGFHVILLLDLLPAHRVDRADRSVVLRDEVVAGRGRAEHRALLDRLRARHAIEFPPNVDALLRLVGTDP